MKLFSFVLLLLTDFHFCINPYSGNSGQESKDQACTIITGAERTDIYFPWLTGKKIAVVANQTSLINQTHLVDSLLGAGLDVVKVFSPEHGFRGMEDAGEPIQDQVDKTTGVPVISLYGDHYKPTKEDLAGIDIILFDIQDVGVRFYTYISTLTYVMEACAEQGIPIIVLDRPNPNGDYVDGPVLEKKYASIVGLYPVPIVYGMTIGEYAGMVNGEGWLKDGIKADLRVVPLKGYDHSCRYDLPVRPSPNLPNADAVCLYPSLALFEGTVVSVGRGTDYPFQVLGHPHFVIGSYAFKPESRPGARHPPYEGVYCLGGSLTGFAKEVCQKERRLHLSWLIYYYEFLKDLPSFFNDYFDKLAGNSSLREQIIAGKSEEDIKATWQQGLDAFKVVRKKYLLYPDFR
ncbi:MAG: DUF1343 domain-containing protein [Bacteroidetes bacterium]|nr:DUF1343 domain-containing protein [Bacteroidota bacterium]